MLAAGLFGPGSKSLLLVFIISVLAMSLMVGTGNPGISFASDSAAREAAKNNVPYGINYSDAARGQAQALNIPGRIQAEDYKIGGDGIGYHDITLGNSGGEYRFDDVDIGLTLDAGGGYKIVSTADGEWLAFDVFVRETGKYDFIVRMSSGEDESKSFHLKIDGVDVTGPISFASSSGYESFVNVAVKNVDLTAGPHELRFVMDTGYFNLNYLDAVRRRPLQIVPVGDSITHANSKRLSYRYPLWTRLIDSEILFNFVGSQNSNLTGDPIWPPHKGHLFDRDHEGHSGWRAEQILDGLPLWLQGYKPDIVLLHIGTNDVFASETIESTVSEISQIIYALRADNPRVLVLLAKIIPTEDSDSNQRINELNSQIEGIAAAKSTIQSRVVIVDQNQGFDVSEDTYDGIHPNETGEVKMAEKWFEAIAEVVEILP